MFFALLQVWPGVAVWPDFLGNANTSKWLTEQVAHFYKQVPFGGLWCVRQAQLLTAADSATAYARTAMCALLVLPALANVYPELHHDAQ
jgi:hypothetical protein